MAACTPLASYCSLDQLHVLWYSSILVTVAACVSALFLHPWPVYSPIPSGTFLPTPAPLQLVLWGDFLIFFAFAIKNYFGPFKPEYGQMAANAVGRTALWNSDMVRDSWLED